jgi:hypothetical protein
MLQHSQFHGYQVLQSQTLLRVSFLCGPTFAQRSSRGFTDVNKIKAAITNKHSNFLMKLIPELSGIKYILLCTRRLCTDFDLLVINTAPDYQD